MVHQDWFTRITGFSERSPEGVRQSISVDGERMTSSVNHATYRCGRLEVPSLEELRKRAQTGSQSERGISVSGVVGDARALHADSSNAGAVFQVASQFNLLEMVSPNVTPERGVGIYEHDGTQGPACAIACGAGTIYRNYFVELDGQTGQSESKQIDCLFEVGEALGNNNQRLWKMQNGYALPTARGLEEVVGKLRSKSDEELDALRGQLRIGVQWDTQVTLEGCEHSVTQAYCSALPVAYSGLPRPLWEPFAKLILEATYEATFAVAIANAATTGNRTLYLTSVGGGAFGNDRRWIESAIKRACQIFRYHELDVKIVCYRSMDPGVEELVRSFQSIGRSKPI